MNDEVFGSNHLLDLSSPGSGKSDMYRSLPGLSFRLVPLSSPTNYLEWQVGRPMTAKELLSATATYPLVVRAYWIESTNLRSAKFFSDRCSLSLHAGGHVVKRGGGGVNASGLSSHLS